MPLKKQRYRGDSPGYPATSAASEASAAQPWFKQTMVKTSLMVSTSGSLPLSFRRQIACCDTGCSCAICPVQIQKPGQKVPTLHAAPPYQRRYFSAHQAWGQTQPKARGICSRRHGRHSNRAALLLHMETIPAQLSGAVLCLSRGKDCQARRTHKRRCAWRRATHSQTHLWR